MRDSLTQRGDTIVEVLIATAVISLVLASAYAITNRNIGTNQDTQEHNQAQQLVQEQLEQLRALAQTKDLATDPGAGFTSGQSCITDPSTGKFDTIIDHCKFTGSGISGCTDEPCYQILISKDASTNIYTVMASWNNVHGETSQVSLEYGV